MSSTPTALPEQQSATAARVVTAAGELLLKRGARGFTVADVATRAHVGKGTVYLYWPTKEDLLLGLVGRGFLALLDDLIIRLDSDPDLARPSRFCPTMLDAAVNHPLVAALQRQDGDLLGMLADHPRSLTLHETLGPSAVIGAVLPVWRRHRMTRSDWDIADQAFALHGLVTGVAMTMMADSRPTTDPLRVVSAAVTALLGPDDATSDDITAAAGEVAAFLRERRNAAVGLIAGDVP
ncbi:TetR/AcrR family transcriptional regulator [Mycobacterium sp. PSTR-4-N]|uniref:TetR/AcrR family transcriptional regulator n=1 Tax=Mycobacterium sp. PSTR-4-N TaxID=2917745 RepID=UPI001F14E7EE|nr:helix-turn-helix domain-containing protein [Mycobacterium sp. PSTR-4-N]MCG7594328.1 TetR/AcrR family transcriptional regulator [Mycobacterium sp. PSTR-4-N]